jgi:hypothetical protein
MSRLFYANAAFFARCLDEKITPRNVTFSRCNVASVGYASGMEDSKVNGLGQFPRKSLEVCLKQGRLLLEKIGSSQVEPSVAASAIGYSTMNGAAMCALAALKSYGLIERPRGRNVSVSDLLERAAKSLDPKLLEEISLSISLFRHMKEGGYDSCTDEVLAQHLQTKGLSPRAAREAIAVFRANAAFLGTPSPSAMPAGSEIRHADIPNRSAAPEKRSLQVPIKPLAAYSFPLAGCDASLVFSGQHLGPEDLEILREHLDVIGRTLAKRQPA